MLIDEFTYRAIQDDTIVAFLVGRDFQRILADLLVVSSGFVVRVLWLTEARDDLLKIVFESWWHIAILLFLTAEAWYIETLALLLLLVFWHWSHLLDLV